MGYATEQCVWPESHVTEEVKSLLGLFFWLADTKADDSGRRMAEEVFTPKGIIQTSQQFQGSEGERTPRQHIYHQAHYQLIIRVEIIASRDHAWDHVQGRKHSIFRVYTRDLSGLDLMLDGQVTMCLKKNDKKLTIPMSIRIVAEGGPQGHRISYMRVFAVCLSSVILYLELRPRLLQTLITILPSGFRGNEGCNAVKGLSLAR
jgi:hypothetical protein